MAEESYETSKGNETSEAIDGDPRRFDLSQLEHGIAT